MHINFLWVDECLRGKKIGENLLHFAETLALENNCSVIYLETFTFQAPEFYRKYVFEESGKFQSVFYEKKFKRMISSMDIVKYEQKYNKDFTESSIKWIEKFFSLESEYLRTIENIEFLIADGAMVFFAVSNNLILSTCMIRHLKKNVWEIGKLSTNENYLGNGAGSKVFEACINYAKEHSAQKIVLFSHTSLHPAIHIYEKFNFKEVPVTNTEYARCNYQAQLLP